MKPIADVAADFDAIAAALAAAPPRDRLTPAESALLRHVPRQARRGLDAGCGDGRLARALASRGTVMLAIDASRRMIDLARARTTGREPVEYCVADIMAAPIRDAAFDAVVSVNMVHHLPLELVVPRLAAAVAPAGVLLVQDVVTRRGARHFPRNVVAALRRRLRQLDPASRVAPRVAALYAAHGVGEEYLSPESVAPAYERLLPGAVVEHHLEWRYTVAWRRPDADHRMHRPLP